MGRVERGLAPMHESFASLFADAPSKLKDEFRVTLDHMAPKAQGDNWRIALDGKNLRFVTQAENRFLHLLDTPGRGGLATDGWPEYERRPLIRAIRRSARPPASLIERHQRRPSCCHMRLYREPGLAHQHQPHLPDRRSRQGPRGPRQRGC